MNALPMLVLDWFPGMLCLLPVNILSKLERTRTSACPPLIAGQGLGPRIAKLTRYQNRNLKREEGGGDSPVSTHGRRKQEEGSQDSTEALLGCLAKPTSTVAKNPLTACWHVHVRTSRGLVLQTGD